MASALEERVRPRTLWSREPASHASIADPTPWLLANGVRRDGRGVFSYSGRFLEQMQTVDALVRGLARELGAVEFEFPQTLSIEAARRARYLVEHPDLAVSAADGEAILSPAICLHYWTLLADSRPSELRIATAAGPCARNEREAGEGLDRLTRFRMREIFAIGPQPAILGLRDDFLSKLRQLAAELDLRASIVTAADSFFLSNAAMRAFQLNMELKHELIATLPPSPTPVAIASVNLHRDHFARAFSIGEGLWSCCLAVGLERAALARMASAKL